MNKNSIWDDLDSKQMFREKKNLDPIKDLCKDEGITQTFWEDDVIKELGKT